MLSESKLAQLALTEAREKLSPDVRVFLENILTKRLSEPAIRRARVIEAVKAAGALIDASSTWAAAERIHSELQAMRRAPLAEDWEPGSLRYALRDVLVACKFKTPHTRTIFRHLSGY